MTNQLLRWARWATLLGLLLPTTLNADAQTVASDADELFQHDETRRLVALVEDATDLVRSTGEAAFTDFAVAGSRWREGETYIFVLDTAGNMLVHPDPALEGRNELDLKDINGKPIIRGLLDAATTFADRPEGWFHYQWPVPGAIQPRWKSSYVRLVAAPSGRQYVVGGGMYNDRMERPFVIDAVNHAVQEVEEHGEAAYPLFRDPTGPFRAKDAYVFVIGMDGVDLVNPAFPNLEGRNLLDVKDTQGKLLIREMLDVVDARGSGWVDYMWPKPGDNVSTQKSTYVRKARLGDRWVLVGCGVYLADAPRELPPAAQLSARELMSLVRQGAAVLEEEGEQAYPEFREEGSRWFRDDTYFFVWTMEPIRVFHAADPASEGEHVGDMKDILGRPIGKLFLEAASSSSGEGWVHYMFPEPGDIFPAWKSTFVKRVTFPSGKEHLIGSGIYNMRMDETFIEDVVNRAAALIAEQGKTAFAQLRDRTGPFVFMDTYVFVDTPGGIELVNGAQPSFEGQSVIDLMDVNGKALARDYIAAAMKDGRAWVEYQWYRPGDNRPARKQAYVRKVEHGDDVYIVGSGLYMNDEPELSSGENVMPTQTQSAVHHRWSEVPAEQIGNLVERRYITGDRMTIANFALKRGAGTQHHAHASEEMLCVIKGTVKVTVAEDEFIVHAGELIQIPGGAPHEIEVLDEAEVIDVFSPIRQDWLDKADTYYGR